MKIGTALFELRLQNRHAMRMLLPISLLLAAWSCNPNTEVVQQFDESGTLIAEFSMDKKTGKRQGPYRFFYPNGKVMEEGWYEQDSLHGTRRLYYESGQLQAEEHIVEGSYEGPWRSWYPSGRLDMEGRYENDKMSGVWKRYYESGQLMEEVTFADNLENGPFREYWPNGRLKAEGTYKDGDYEHGLLLLYDESGQLERKMDCKRGICRTIWTRDQGDIQDPHLDSLQRRLEQLIEAHLSN